MKERGEGGREGGREGVLTSKALSVWARRVGE